MKPDIQKLIAEHVELTKRCYELASKAIEAVKAGKKKEAKALQAEAKAMMRRMVEIEAATRGQSPHGTRDT